MASKKKDYKYYERMEGRKVICHIVAETPQALETAIAEYRKLYLFHDCSRPYEKTGLTANLSRFPHCD